MKLGVCPSSSLRSSSPSRSQRGAEKRILLHACVASSQGLPGRTRAPRAEDQLACVVRFLWPGLGADTCPLLPGANERDEQDGLPRPLPGAKDLARAVAAFADLEVSFLPARGGDIHRVGALGRPAAGASWRPDHALQLRKPRQFLSGFFA